MNDPVETIRSFYAKLADGDAPGALGLMSADIEWNTMWHYKVDGRGPSEWLRDYSGRLWRNGRVFHSNQLNFFATEIPSFLWVDSAGNTVALASARKPDTLTFGP